MLSIFTGDTTYKPWFDQSCFDASFRPVQWSSPKRGLLSMWYFMDSNYEPTHSTIWCCHETRIRAHLSSKCHRDWPPALVLCACALEHTGSGKCVHRMRCWSEQSFVPLIRSPIDRCYKGITLPPRWTWIVHPWYAELNPTRPTCCSILRCLFVCHATLLAASTYAKGDTIRTPIETW